METIALGALGENLLAEARSASSGRCAVTIHGGHVNSLRQTAIGLAAGHALDEHENTGEITLQIIRGRARVVAASGDAQLVAGDYVVDPAGMGLVRSPRGHGGVAHRLSAGQSGLT